MILVLTYKNIWYPVYYIHTPDTAWILAVLYCSLYILPSKEPTIFGIPLVPLLSFSIMYSYTGYGSRFSHSPSEQAVLTITIL